MGKKYKSANKRKKLEKVSPDTTGKTNKVEIRGIVISICLITIITSIAFFPSLKNDFTNWDDNKYVTENTLIRDLSWGNIKTIFISRKTFFSGNYHPLTVLSYSLEYHFFKLNPEIYHLTNVIFHIFNSLLVFWLVYLISGKISVSLVAGILFGIHPLRVESVAWISERKDMLSTFFFLFAVIGYLYYTKKKSMKYYYITLSMLILSLLSKAMAITFPFVLLLCDYFLNRKFNRNILIEKIPFFVISLIFGIIAIIAQGGSESIRQNPSVLYNFFIASHGIVFYLAKMAVPANLSCLYIYPAGVIRKLPPMFLFSPVMVIALGIMIFLSKKYNRKIIFGSLFFLITVSPVIQLMPVGRAIAADRYTYIPFIGLFYMLGEGFTWLYYRKTNYSGLLKNFLIIFSVGIIVMFSSLTRQRCLVWGNGVSLWEDFFKTGKEYPLAYTNLGNAYSKRGEYDKAIYNHSQAIRMAPDFADAYYNRGLAYNNTGEHDKAIFDFSQAIKFIPDFSMSYLNLGLAYLGKGEVDKAMSYYAKAIEIDPNYAEAYYNRGLVYADRKEYDKSVSEYSRAIEVKPDFHEAYLNRGMMYGIEGKYDKAISDLGQVIRINPDSAKAYNNRGNAHSNKGEYDKAIADYTEALKAKPDKSSIYYYNRGIAYDKKGNYDKAISDYSQAIKIDPDCNKAYFNRGENYYKMKQYNKSWADFSHLQDLGYKINPEFLEFLRKKIKQLIQ